jgi:hypothetical protein
VISDKCGAWLFGLRDDPARLLRHEASRFPSLPRRPENETLEIDAFAAQN